MSESLEFNLRYKKQNPFALVKKELRYFWAYDNDEGFKHLSICYL